MSVKVENLEKNMAKLTIEVPFEELDAAIEKVYLKNKSKIQLPGFRKGKAPRAMIEKLYGRGIFMEDAVNEIVPEAYDKAAEESGLEIVSSPEIEPVQVEYGKDLIFSATVAVKPEVKLGEYKGIEVETSPIVVTEAEVDAAITREQEKNAVKNPVEDRPVKDTDEVVIDFEGFCDGVAFEGGKGTDHTLTIGSHTFVDTFEDQIIGHSIGDEFDVNVTFPENYHTEDLAGKPATFKVALKSIKEKVLPEIDDEFASEVSDFDTLEEYKEDIRKNIRESKEKAAKTAKENVAIMKLVAASEMEIPDAMVETQARGMYEDFARRMENNGISMEQYMQYTNMTEENLMEEMRPTALEQIQNRLVLEAVAAAENIEVSADEVQDEIKKMADSYGVDTERILPFLGDKGLENVKSDLAIQKAAELIAANAVEVEKKAEETEEEKTEETAE